MVGSDDPIRGAFRWNRQTVGFPYERVPDVEREWEWLEQIDVLAGLVEDPGCKTAST